MRSIVDNRLIYHGERADQPDFWTSHWRQTDIEKTLTASRSGYLGDYETVFARHLPRDGRVLEAGCGYGRYVLALQARGYSVTGVEFSEETVDISREIAPGIDVVTGDVLNLDFPDGAFDAYVSLGVLEHFVEGPEQALSEAYRVLCPNGTMICSVPYFNPYRRRILSETAPTDWDRETFYQFAYREQEFRETLEANGFQCEKVYYHGLAKGLKDEVEWVATLQKSHQIFSKFLWQFGRIPWVLPRYFAHMVTYVATRMA